MIVCLFHYERLQEILLQDAPVEPFDALSDQRLGLLNAGGHMELRQVEYAVAVSEELTFTGAAKRCGVSQPTITNAIRKLEQELGGPLFRRRPAVQLTEFGQRLLPEFYRVKDICAAIVRLAALPHGTSGGAERPHGAQTWPSGRSGT
jgi:molybdenum-dependent DNA-binding transcriptional regulator ModE